MVGRLGGKLTYRMLWANRPFRLLWVGTLAMRLGMQIGVIDLTWLVLKSTGSGEKIGVVLALYAVGDIVASPFVGVLLDRWPRKLLLSADVLAQAILFMVLGILFAAHHLPFLLLLGLVSTAGALSPLAYLGRMIILPNVVSDEGWEAANTVMQLNMNLVTLLGPALGGLLVAVMGIAATVMITALTSFFYCGVLLQLSRSFYQSKQSHRPQPFKEEIAVGWKFLRKVPLLLTLVIVTLFFSLTYGPLEPALPILVQSVFKAGPQILGLLWSSFALGAIIGTFLWGYYRPRWPLRHVVAGIIILWGLCSGLVGVTGNAWVAMVFLALGGLTYAPYNILYSVWRQRLVPDTLRGKVFGAINSVTGIGLPLGQALGGFLIGAVGASMTVRVGGVACVVLGFIVYGKKSLWVIPPDASGLQSSPG